MTTGRSDESVERDEQREAQPAADPAAPGPEAEEAAGNGSEVGDELDELVVGLRRERDEYLALAQRAKADFENYRKRATREAAEAERRGRLALARELVPSLDSLERALGSAEPGSDVARGLELVHGELTATLGRAGVEAFDPAGERFDPTHSEAISTAPAGEGAEPGTVLETVERGYRSDGTVLRPARVIVSE
jgi:molecular chaperone GrpE